MKENKVVHLTMTNNNVAHWGFWEAIRELIQNHLDMEKRNFYVEDGLVNISTFDYPMAENTLLVGNSTKRDDETKIGKYGEGYKLACLVLLREGYDVTIRNGLDKWTFIEEVHPLLDHTCVAVKIEYDVFPNIDETSKNTVTFSVKGLSEYDHLDLQNKYLEKETIQNNFEVILDYNGNTLFRGEDFPSVYVNGLFVCTLPENYWFSYNLNPDMVPLDRDRSAVDTWELNWTIARLLEAAEAYDLIADMSENKCPDLHEYYSPSKTKFFSTVTDSLTTVSEKLAELTRERFIQKYGINSFPINENAKPEKKKLLSRKAVAAGLVPITVTKNHYSMLPDDLKKIDGQTLVGEVNPITLMQSYLKENKKHMRSKAVKNFNQMIDTLILIS